MSSESIVTIVVGILQTGAVSFVIYMIVKGLKEQVSGLKKTVDIQNKTIEAMDRRVVESEKISELYRSFIEDYPKALESYKSTIVRTKDDVIVELTKRVEGQKDEIKELQEKITKLNPEERASFERITGLLLTEPFKSFQEFIHKIDERKEKIVYNILKSPSIDEFMRLNGYTLIVDNDLGGKLVSQDELVPLRIRTASFSMNGTAYAFTFGKEFLVNDTGKANLNRFIGSLQN